MGSTASPGSRFRAAFKEERPLQIVGVINAYTAILAEKAGFGALYLSGAGVANASFGLPDLGLTTLDQVLEDVQRITGASLLPLLVDADTGWGRNLPRAVRELAKAGAAGLHLEDQIAAKRCGHRPGKRIVGTREMVARIQTAADARMDSSFVIMARTDAATVEGLHDAIDRACAYREAGADMIFAEALRDLDDYRAFTRAVGIPVLANMTEFGVTPLYSAAELGRAGVRMVLYPLSAFRAMSASALKVYRTIRKNGSQKKVIDLMQTREELYDILDYEKHEKLIESKLTRDSRKSTSD
jgi:methylisocitrate lyase